MIFVLPVMVLLLVSVPVMVTVNVPVVGAVVLLVLLHPTPVASMTKTSMASKDAQPLRRAMQFVRKPKRRRPAKLNPLKVAMLDKVFFNGTVPLPAAADADAELSVNVLLPAVPGDTITVGGTKAAFPLSVEAVEALSDTVPE